MDHRVDEEKPKASESPSSSEKRGQFIEHAPPDEPFVVHGEVIADPDAGLSDAERAHHDRRVVAKLDLYLVPWLTLLYLISFLDRTNIGNAKLAGLPADLHLSADGSQFNIALTVFFVSYSLFEPVTNVLLKLLRPSIFIPIIMICWGIVMTCMGLVTNFSGLVATRFFLGLAEAGLFPGINFYISCWWKRREIGKRAAVFFAGAALAGSFGGLLAYALEKMDGIGGKAGWAWIFIIEGLLTVVIGIISFWMVHDFPDNATFLSADDRARVLRRLRADQQSSAHHETFRSEYIWAALRDPKTWLSCIVYMGTDGSLYAFSLFLPTIINGLGTYNTVESQLLTIPPYAAAAIATVAVGWLSDRTQQRGLANIACALVGMTGFAMLLGAPSPAVRYAGTFLGALGIYPTIANTISWGASNFDPVYKRGVATGIFIGWGNLNGIMSSNVYLARDAPAYRIGHGIILAYLTIFLFGGSIVQWLYLRRENHRKLRGDYDYRVQGKSPEEVARLGDLRPSFIYSL